MRRRTAPLLLLALLVPLLALVGATSPASAASSQAAPAAERTATAQRTTGQTGTAQRTAAQKAKAQKTKAQRAKAQRAKAQKARAQKARAQKARAQKAAQAKRAEARAKAAAAAKAKAAAAAKPAPRPAPQPAPQPVVTPPPPPLPVPPLVGGVEDYARYEPQRTCSPAAKPGATAGLRWAVATYGGRAGGISRACGGAASEHKEGRAFDWTLDATKPAERAAAERYLAALFATGPTGQPAEMARRMGVMYIIWDDQMYASYRQFQPTAYVSSSCRGKPLAQCSPTLRHRDHVHVSLSWAGGLAQTSWYATPDAARFR